MSNLDENCAPIYREPQLFVEQTLALIKPEAVDKSFEIEDIILRAGFTILKVSQSLLVKLE
jgi:nucleoside diphosphate kinase